MKLLRVWILTLAGVSFLAGAAAGCLFGMRLQPPPAERRPFADYEALLTERFGLEGKRVRGLRAVLDTYARGLEDVRARHMGAIEPELADLGLTCRRRIRDKVLPPDRRDEFDALADLGAHGATRRDG